MNALFSTPYFAAILAFGSVMLAYVAVLGFVGSVGRADKLKDRIDSMAGASHHPESKPFLQIVREYLSMGLWETLGRVGQKFLPKKGAAEENTRVKLLQAGLRNSNAVRVLMGVRVLLMVLFVMPPLVIFLVSPESLGFRPAMVAMVLGAGIGYYLPGLWLSMRISSRKKKIIKEIPDALDLLVVCVEAGMGLDQAIHRVCTELSKAAPLFSEELRILNLELRAGQNRHDALKNLSTRVGLQDVESLVTLLIQADLFGTSVAQTLRVYSDTLRTNRYQMAEEKAAKLPVKLLFPLMLFIFPALFVVIVGPAAINLAGVFGQIGQ